MYLHLPYICDTESQLAVYLGYTQWKSIQDGAGGATWLFLHQSWQAPITLRQIAGLIFHKKNVKSIDFEAVDIIVHGSSIAVSENYAAFLIRR